MYACICKGLTESDVKYAGLAGAITASALVATLGLDSDDACGRCAMEIDSFVELATDCGSLGGSCAGCAAVCDRRHN